MASKTELFLLWAPRGGGILMALFLALFALDAFTGKPFIEGLAGFAVHLIPTCLVLAVVAVAWRHPWVGAVAFFGLAVAYGVMVHWRIDWVAAISGPLLVVGLLFLLSWGCLQPVRTGAGG